jgi:hypothetical protein
MREVVDTIVAEEAINSKLSPDVIQIMINSAIKRIEKIVKIQE